jgi:hypothetical protein
LSNQLTLLARTWLKIGLMNMTIDGFVIPSVSEESLQLSPHSIPRDLFTRATEILLPRLRPGCNYVRNDRSLACHSEHQRGISIASIFPFLHKLPARASGIPHSVRNDRSLACHSERTRGISVASIFLFLQKLPARVSGIPHSVRNDRSFACHSERMDSPWSNRTRALLRTSE